MAIILDGGADVALFPLSMANHGEELEFNAKTKVQDAQGNRIPSGVKENVIFSSK